MQRFKSILFYAGTENNEVAMRRACELAVENQAALTFMDVVRPVPKTWGLRIDIGDPETVEQRFIEEHTRSLRELAAECSDSKLLPELVVKVGDPGHEIVRQVLRGNHDLVVKTADEFAGMGRLFGTVARSLLRTCPCPVWLLKPEVFGQFDHVLAAVDVVSDDEEHIAFNEEILKLAHFVASREDAQLHVVAAWEPRILAADRAGASQKELDALTSRFESRVYQALDELLHVDYAKSQDFQRHVQRGRSADVIQRVAAKVKADLLVMGTIRRTGIPGFLIGSTAETVLTDVDCSVLAIKPKGFVSPVP